MGLCTIWSQHIKFFPLIQIQIPEQGRNHKFSINNSYSKEITNDLQQVDFQVSNPCEWCLLSEYRLGLSKFAKGNIEYDRLRFIVLSKSLCADLFPWVLLWCKCLRILFASMAWAGRLWRLHFHVWEILLLLKIIVLRSLI